MRGEIRRVPANWKHPKDARGEYIATHEHLPYLADEIEEGLRDGWLKNEPPHFGIAFMPQWPKRE